MNFFIFSHVLFLIRGETLSPQQRCSSPQSFFSRLYFSGRWGMEGGINIACQSHAALPGDGDWQLIGSRLTLPQPPCWPFFVSSWWVDRPSPKYKAYKWVGRPYVKNSFLQCEGIRLVLLNSVLALFPVTPKIEICWGPAEMPWPQNTEPTTKLPGEEAIYSFWVLLGTSSS